MTTYGFAPDCMVHSGATLREALEDRSMSQTELATRSGLSAKTIGQILNGAAPISPDVASKLERALGIPARVWNNLQSNYDETAKLT